MKIVAISDAHLSSLVKGVKNTESQDNPGATFKDEARYGFKPGCRAFKLLFNGYRPGLPINETTVMALAEVRRAINELEPDVVLLVGDMFNLGSAKDRDKHTSEFYPTDVHAVLTTFVESIDAPTLATPGNGDVFSSETMEDDFVKLSALNTGLDEFNTSGKLFEVNQTGNIVVEKDNTTVALLNSIGPFNYRDHYNVEQNNRFLRRVIAESTGDNLVLATHHSPFHMFVEGFQAVPCEPWIVNELEVRAREQSKRSLVVNGHLHRYLEQSNGGGVDMVMLQPLFYDMGNREDRSNIGTLIVTDDVNPGNFRLSQVRSEMLNSILLT